MFACTEGEQMEECDDTASPNDESPYETGDSDVDLYYSLSDDSHQTVLIATALHCVRLWFLH